MCYMFQNGRKIIRVYPERSSTQITFKITLCFSWFSSKTYMIKEKFSIHLSVNYLGMSFE